jgi:GH25 family lysozyme M1 (1,4-beta-N-acetylmuramidase)
MSYIKGIDISNNDGAVDCAKIAADGVEYVYIKATEGQSYQDPYMEQFFQGCKDNGLKVGAYHFLVGTSTPEAQAANFYKKIKDYEWDLVPMMDIETSFDGLANYVIRFVNAFKQLSPLQLGVYSYTSFLNQITAAKSTIQDFPFWEANYNNDPWNLPDNDIFSNRIGHQYTEKGQISGVYCNCDVNSFTDGVLLTDKTIPGKWILQDNKWWYKHEDGSYTKNGWEKIDSKWYLFDSEGYMVYSWKKDGNNWYFLGGADDGSMKSGWLLQNNIWYYLGNSSDGSMKTGWQKIEDKWYYFNKDGAMQTGWIADGNKLYCCYSNGEMIHDTTLYGYSFNSSGEATKIN